MSPHPALKTPSPLSSESSVSSIILSSLPKSAQKYKESEISPYLQANKPDCHKYIDAPRRHKPPGSEERGFVAHCSPAP